LTDAISSFEGVESPNDAKINDNVRESAYNS